MRDTPTGPELFTEADSFIQDAAAPQATDSTDQDQMLNAVLGAAAAIQANNAALVMFAGLFADARGMRSRELEVWNEVIPAPPLVECWGKDTRRPACEKRHTEDCAYADPPPEPKHVLLDVGTRVLVSDWRVNPEGELRLTNPQPGRISGYDMHRSKYRWQREYEPGIYAKHDSWAFVDNRVEVHPDGPECPPPPKPVKREPTGPLVYVQHIKGHQGYIIGTEATESGDHWHTVRWLKPGSPEERLNVRLVHVIAKSELERCDNGQTREECTEVDLCVACEQDRDEEGDAIEESMELR